MSKTDSTPAAPAAGTDKKKRQVTPSNFVLMVETTDDKGAVTYSTLPMPEGIDLNNPKHRSRGVIEAAVKRNLEEDKNVERYNDKKLHVVDLGQVFSFHVVEEVKKTRSVEPLKSV